MKLPNGEQAIVPLEKLHDYCLNPRHRVGGYKAHVFEAVLGVQNAYGQRYIIDFVMTTAMGTAVVRSTWIVLIGQDVPRLTSCYIL